MPRWFDPPRAEHEAHVRQDQEDQPKDADVLTEHERETVERLEPGPRERIGEGHEHDGQPGRWQRGQETFTPRQAIDDVAPPPTLGSAPARIAESDSIAHDEPEADQQQADSEAHKHAEVGAHGAMLPAPGPSGTCPPGTAERIFSAMTKGAGRVQPSPGLAARAVQRLRSHIVTPLDIVILVAIAGTLWLADTLPGFFAATDKVQNDIVAASHGQIVEAVDLKDDAPRFVIWTDIDTAGASIACTFVRPVLVEDGIPDGTFEVRDRVTGTLLASNRTTCPTP